MPHPSAALDLPLTVEELNLHGLELQTAGGWNRRTTVVVLSGKGVVGYGEDVTYDGEAQQSFQQRGAPAGLAGSYTLRSFAAALDAIAESDWFPQAPAQQASLHYRRWAFESAALDLALKQTSLSLAQWMAREPRPVQFVHSIGLGDPPDLEVLRARRKVIPELRFKLDWQESWDRRLLTGLRALGAVDVVDFKGHYRGSFQGPAPDPRAYALVAEQLPDVFLEDPAWTEDCAHALTPHEARVTWDAPLHLLRDLEDLPFVPQVINVKPSRFATVERLLRVLQWMEDHGVRGYGGGQFELGPGRCQLQHLAALCYPDAPNDVAPVDYHQDAWLRPPPKSPLTGFASVVGFGGWSPA